LIIEPAPAPPPLVAHALARLSAAPCSDPGELAALGDQSELARPWDPATCGELLRQQIWEWCDQFAAWVNRGYAWRPVHMIPACWPRHPHIAAELPMLACLRLAADAALTPDALEAWHRVTLPAFLDRLAERLGDSGCRNGQHHEWPAAARYAAYRGETVTASRASWLHAETAPL
jgi:hypothetical protein